MAGYRLLKYLLDTNVISEIRKGPGGHPSVMQWWSQTEISDLHLSVMVVGEIRQGIERLRLRDAGLAHDIEVWLAGIVALFGPRMLVVNTQIADTWGSMGVARTLPLVDSLLAATALVHDLTLVTRNTRDIVDCGASYLNPFEV